MFDNFLSESIISFIVNTHFLMEVCVNGGVVVTLSCLTLLCVTLQAV